MTAKSYEVRVPNHVENTGLDSSRFPTAVDAEQAITVLRDMPDYAEVAAEVYACNEAPNTTFERWNSAGW